MLFVEIKYLAAQMNSTKYSFLFKYIYFVFTKKKKMPPLN